MHASLLLPCQQDAVEDIGTTNVSFPPPTLVNFGPDNVVWVLGGAEDVVAGQLAKLTLVAEAEPQSDVLGRSVGIEMEDVVIIVLVVSVYAGAMRHSYQAEQAQE
jgi:hypothetical protein